MRIYNSSRWSVPLLVAAMVCLTHWARTQTTLYSETFTGQNGKGATGDGDGPPPEIDLGGVTWTIDVSAATLGSGDYFRVVNGVLEGTDLDGPAVWFSPVINISGYANVSFTLDASEAGSHESSDYYDVEFRVNGGAWQKILNWNDEGSATRTFIDDWGSETPGRSGLSGNTLELRVTMNNSNNDEFMRLDNVLVVADLPRLIINEVSYNPCGSEQGDDDDCEFIEIYNAGSTAVNLAGYELDGDVEYTFGSVSIAAGAYILLVVDEDDIEDCFDNIPGGIQILEWDDGELSNSSGDIFLINANDIIIDQFSYDDGGDGDDCPNADGNCATLQYTGAGDNTDCTSGNWAADDPSPGAVNSGVLPIELVSFTGQVAGSTIELTWQSSGERNNDYMAVERSPDGLAFDEIGRVPGRGTTYEAQTYAFVDEYPLPGINYYRLRQVDYDGTTEYHPVISVVFAGKAGAELRVRAYPNPAREELRVEWTSPGRPGAAAAVLRVFDSSGRQLAQYALNGSGGVYNVPVGNLPAGVYVLQLAQGRSVETMRFVKE